MAGLIPQDFIDDLITRADIVEVVGRHIQLKKAGREFKACCPFHDEKTPSFTVSPSKGFYHCFGCGANGTAIGFLMEFNHMSFIDAIETLASSMGMEVPRNESDQPAQRYDELFSLMDSVTRHWQSCLKKTPAAIEAWPPLAHEQLGVAIPRAPLHGERIFFLDDREGKAKKDCPGGYPFTSTKSTKGTPRCRSQRRRRKR